MSAPPPGSQHQGDSPRPSRLQRTAVGVAVLSFYGLLALGSIVVLTAIWQFRPSPVVLVLGVVVGTLVVAFLSLRLGTRQVLATVDAWELPASRAPVVYDLLAAVADEMAVEQPRLLVARLGMPNALALPTPGRGTLVVDASLFRLLDAAEFEALLAHELAHLERHDSLVQTTALSLTQFVVITLELLLSPLVFLVTGAALGIAWLRGEPRSWAETVPGRLRARIEMGIALLGVTATLFLRAHARRREFAADERAAEVTGRPLALASALQKLDRSTRPDFGSVSPLWTHGEVPSEEERRLREYFSTHPRIEDRIARLRERAAESAVRVPVE
ncbi:M48 family metallopeptidase [Halobellus inordinatus]|uniref:M48 family metallopeptidase n=1 Tax=Halobellus inordinatus TaxID=1126236 RepID=UPI002114E62F|nr:M48 family metalloprotease [Halobellus ramosii]